MQPEPTLQGSDVSEQSSSRPAHPPRKTIARFALLAAAVVAIAGAATAIYIELRPAPPPERPMAFFTVDDGKSWFTADAESLPPFDYKGQKAVKAYVYTCDGGKTRFVAWLQKLPEDALREALAKGPVDDDVIAMKAGWMAKRPGDGEWVNSKSDPEKFAEITKVTCPGGGNPNPIYASENTGDQPH